MITLALKRLSDGPDISPNIHLTFVGSNVASIVNNVGGRLFVLGQCWVKFGSEQTLCQHQPNISIVSTAVSGFCCVHLTGSHNKSPELASTRFKLSCYCLCYQCSTLTH